MSASANFNVLLKFDAYIIETILHCHFDGCAINCTEFLVKVM